MEQRYKEAIDFLYSQLPMFSRTGAPAYKPGLETSIELSKYFGDSHQQFKSIHIGGTNGKGSTSHMIASVLQSQGYKVGLYTSPHLVDFRERMRINGEMIPEEKVVEFVEEWRKSGYKGHPSFFELTMIMAFNWFAKEKVDYAVIEVGMGGRLDSTNIINPLLSVITNISHDHNQFLGNTLQEIAQEKAGIIKSGVPVVIGETQTETEGVFRNKANEINAPIIFAENCQGDSKIEMAVKMPLGGDYQKKNLKTVLTALEELRKLGVEISDSSIKEGIENVCKQTGLMGRWMIINHEGCLGKEKSKINVSKKISDNQEKGEICREPEVLVIADTGHNIGGLTYNFKQLDRLIKERKENYSTAAKPHEEKGSNDRKEPKLRIVIGFVADKAIDKILKLLPRDAEYYVTNAQIPRALPADKLMEKFESAGIRGRKFDSVKEAYIKAKEEASEKDIIFIGGSTFIVADFLLYLSLCAGRGS